MAKKTFKADKKGGKVDKGRGKKGRNGKNGRKSFKADKNGVKGKGKKRRRDKNADKKAGKGGKGRGKKGKNGRNPFKTDKNNDSRVKDGKKKGKKDTKGKNSGSNLFSKSKKEKDEAKKVSGCKSIEEIDGKFPKDADVETDVYFDDGFVKWINSKPQGAGSTTCNLVTCQGNAWVFETYTCGTCDLAGTKYYIGQGIKVDKYTTNKCVVNPSNPKGASWQVMGSRKFHKAKPCEESCGKGRS